MSSSELSFWRVSSILYAVKEVSHATRCLIFRRVSAAPGGDMKGERWLENLLKTNPTVIGHPRVEDGMVLTAPPKELQKFLLGHLQEGFGEVTEFERPSQQDEETGAE